MSSTHPLFRSNETRQCSGRREECSLVRHSHVFLFVLPKLSTSSAIIQDITTLRDAGLAFMAYFYFDFKDTDKQSRRNLILSLLSQLSARSDICCDMLYRIYLTHDKGAYKPTDDVLIQSLKEALKFSNHGPIFIIVDAIDECPNTFGMPSPRELVLDLVKELVGLSLLNLHLCITSRPEIDIRTALEPLTSHQVSLHDQTGQKKDIVEYVRSVVRSDARMGKWRDEDQNMVIKTLSDKADGMYVPNCYRYTTVAHILAGFDGFSANWRFCAIVSLLVCDVFFTNFPSHWTKPTSVF